MRYITGGNMWGVPSAKNIGDREKRHMNPYDLLDLFLLRREQADRIEETTNDKAAKLKAIVLGKTSDVELTDVLNHGKDHEVILAAGEKLATNNPQKLLEHLRRR